MRKIALIRLLLFILVIMFCLTSLLVNVQAGSWGWTKVADNVDLQSVDMANSTDGWIVGWEGRILHWDGTKWNNIGSPTTADLRAVNTVSSNEVYAIAFAVVIPLNESVIRCDGTSWSNVTTPRAISGL